MVEALMLVSLTRHQSYDRRGRSFVDGHFVDFETELETFRALAAKYLKCNIKEILPSDAEHPRFTLDTAHNEVTSGDDWARNTTLLPAKGGVG